jgi:hypothetical protein
MRISESAPIEPRNPTSERRCVRLHPSITSHTSPSHASESLVSRLQGNFGVARHCDAAGRAGPFRMRLGGGHCRPRGTRAAACGGPRPGWTAAWPLYGRHDAASESLRYRHDSDTARHGCGPTRMQARQYHRRHGGRMRTCLRAGKARAPGLFSAASGPARTTKHTARAHMDATALPGHGCPI